jgi:hypothetical protein
MFVWTEGEIASAHICVRTAACAAHRCRSRASNAEPGVALAANHSSRRSRCTPRMARLDARPAR